MATDENVPAHLRLGALNRLTDLQVAESKKASAAAEPAAADDEAPDPMRDLDLMEEARQLKLAGAISARQMLTIQTVIQDGGDLDEIEERLRSARARHGGRAPRRNRL
jgi:hypothetical protein